MDHTKKSTYLFSIDALRVIAILAVILIHITTKTLQILDHNVLDAPFTLFLNQASRFAVPLFFLISGIVLELNNKPGISYSVFFRKRASRIVAPYIFWSALYFYVGWGFDVTNLFSLRFLTDILYGNASYHLYFIPTLILFYLAFPFLHKGTNYIKRPLIIISVLIFIGIFQIKDYYFGTLNLQPNLRIAYLSFSMFVVGMAVSHFHQNILKFVEKHKNIFLFSTIVICLLIFSHVMQLTMTRKTAGYIYNQYSPLNYIYTLLLSSYLSYFFEKTKLLKGFFVLLSSLSFFVFFIHVFILEIVWNQFANRIISVFGESALRGIWFDIVMLVIVSTLSFGIALLVHKIPRLSKLTG